MFLSFSEWQWFTTKGKLICTKSFCDAAIAKSTIMLLALDLGTSPPPHTVTKQRSNCCLPFPFFIVFFFSRWQKEDLPM